MAASLILRTVKGTPLTNIEVDNNFSNLNTFGDVVSSNIGVLSALTTTNQSNIVYAVNELKSNIGVVANLTTSNISNLVSAINEVNASSGVTASTYGGAAVQSVFTVNAKGRITSASNVTTTVANSNITGNIISSQIQPTGVTASTYGAAAVQAVITVDQQGRITSASNVTSTVANSNITGNIISSQIQPTGVTATTYGNATIVPSFVVDQQGRITSASNISISFPAAAAGGSGLFNTSISSATGYAVTTSMATAYTAASTAGKRYIVHSIQVTNINTASADISGQFTGSTYSSIAFANTVPVPAGSSVELLKKPKVLQPSDTIDLQASLSSYLHATITIEEVTGITHFGVGVDVTSAATYTDLHTATANSVIESVLLSNDDGTNDVKARVVWTDGSSVIQGYFVYDIIVPADSTIEVLEQPKFLPNGYKVQVYGNQANRLESIIAGKLTGT